MSKFEKNFWKFIYTGEYDLTHKETPRVLKFFDFEIASIQGRIAFLENELKIENLPFDHPIAIEIRAEIERLRGSIERFRKRKSQLIK